MNGILVVLNPKHGSSRREAQSKLPFVEKARAGVLFEYTTLATTDWLVPRAHEVVTKRHPLMDVPHGVGSRARRVRFSSLDISIGAFSPCVGFALQTTEAATHVFLHDDDLFIPTLLPRECLRP